MASFIGNILAAKALLCVGHSQVIASSDDNFPDGDFGTGIDSECAVTMGAKSNHLPQADFLVTFFAPNLLPRGSCDAVQESLNEEQSGV
jgi:hypothetical protein